ncbi:MAG: S4 domain-containing protein, partial [Gammaproteobacteria bacterium]
MHLNKRFVITAEQAGGRLDKTLADLCPEFSRESLKNWILEGKVKVNSEIKKPREKVLEGSEIVLDCEIEEPQDWEPEDLPIEIIYEDADLIIINKQAGLTVHPGAGQKDGTLVNALLHRYPELQILPRAG